MTTITARHTARRLRTIAPIVEDVYSRLPLVVIAIRDASDAATDDCRHQPPSGGDADNIKPVGRVSDPTSAAALAHMAFAGRHLDALADDLQTFVTAALRLAEHCDRWVVSAANAEEHPRCTGGGGVDDWCDPTCVNPVMSNRRDDGSHSYNRDGLCVACYQRRRRWLKQMDEREVA